MKSCYFLGEEFISHSKQLSNKIKAEINNLINQNFTTFYIEKTNKFSMKCKNYLKQIAKLCNIKIIVCNSIEKELKLQTMNCNFFTLLQNKIEQEFVKVLNMVDLAIFYGLPKNFGGISFAINYAKQKNIPFVQIS